MSYTPYQGHVLDIYEKSFQDNWALPALTDIGSKEVLTYGEFARRIARMHLFFSQTGVQPGDKVALLGKNSATCWCLTATATCACRTQATPTARRPKS